MQTPGLTLPHPLPPALPASPALPHHAAAAAYPSPAAEDAKVRQAVHDANRFTKAWASSVEFSVDQESGRHIVKIVDTSTGQVIRQLPSPEMIEIAHMLDRLQKLLFRQKA